MITISDLELALGTTKEEIYETDFDNLVAEIISSPVEQILIIE